MICPNCNSKIDSKNGVCPMCGAELNGAAVRRSGNGGSANYVATSAGGMGMLFGAAARAARANAAYSTDEVISDRLYNGILLGVLLWGLIVNFVLCHTIGDVSRYIHPTLFLILYLVFALAGILIARKSTNPWISFLGYNMIVVPIGLTISTAVAAYGGITSTVVRDAFLYTMLITVGITGAAIAFPKLFEKLGGVLIGCLIGIIVCETVLLIFFRGSSTLNNIIDWAVAGLFSVYIGYDVYRSQQFPKTFDNAVDSAIDIYLDVANLFFRILSIIARNRRRD